MLRCAPLLETWRSKEASRERSRAVDGLAGSRARCDCAKTGLRAARRGAPARRLPCSCICIRQRWSSNFGFTSGERPSAGIRLHTLCLVGGTCVRFDLGWCRSWSLDAGPAGGLESLGRRSYAGRLTSNVAARCICVAADTARRLWTRESCRLHWDDPALCGCATRRLRCARVRERTSDAQARGRSAGRCMRRMGGCRTRARMPRHRRRTHASRPHPAGHSLGRHRHIRRRPGVGRSRHGLVETRYASRAARSCARRLPLELFDRLRIRADAAAPALVCRRHSSPPK